MQMFGKFGVTFLEFCWERRMPVDQPIRFPPFLLDPHNARLWRGAQAIHLRPLAFAVLSYLLQRPDQLVTREALLTACWPDTTVAADDAVNSCIREIREKLGDQARTPQFIETVYKHGYRFIGPITSPTERPSVSQPEAQGAVHPFIAGVPITHPRHFFGREHALQRLFNLWMRLPLQNAAIIGPGQSGKTSVLAYLHRITTTPPAQLRPGQRVDWLPYPERYRWIFVDFQDPRLGSREGLLRYLLAHLEVSAPTPCDLERFLDVVADQLRSPTILLLDKIDVALRRYAELDNAFWEALRALATNQVEGNLAFVLAARERPEHLAHHSGLSSPFFNIFGYTTFLGPLTEPEARALVASAPLPFPPADVDWILTHSGRWPLLLQLLCRERLTALEEDDPSTAWQEDGLNQMTPFRHLLASP